MTNQAVYEGALRLIGEEPGASDLGDYAARAPYLLFTACRALASLDRLCRGAFAYAEQMLPAGSEYPLTADFPLCEELAPAAALHLASALLFDENPSLSDKLYTRFGEETAALMRSLPARVEKIKDSLI